MNLRLIFAGFFGATGIILAAATSHYFPKVLSPGQVNSLKTAVDMQIFHALFLLFHSLSDSSSRWAKASFSLAVAGIFCFSFSIYGLTAGLRFLWPVTPFGGVLLIIAWACVIPMALYQKGKK